MKKTGLFKIAAFIMLGIIVASWLFAGTYYTNGELQDLGMYNIGFFDSWQLLFSSFEFSYFIQIIILLVSIGALYGVLGKTGKYKAWINKIAGDFKGSELVFLLFTSFIIAVLTSVFDYGFMMVVFFPLIISIILAMGYDKITACLTTFGAILVGTIGSTTSYNTSGVINGVLSADITNALLIKIVLFVLSLATLFYFLFKAKRNKLVNEDVKDDPFVGESSSNKYSIVHIIIIFSLLLVLMILGCTAWTDSFGIEIFTKLNKTITTFDFKMPYFHITSDGLDYGVAKIAVFGKLLGKVNAFGQWYYPEMTMLCLMSAIILGLVYRVEHIFGAMAEGAKKMLKPAMLVGFIYVIVYLSGNTMIYPTIAVYLLKITKTFNVFFATICAILGSALNVDMLYVANYVVPQIAGSGASIETASILSQGIYGVTMFITPTSALIALGLSYLGINYKEWVKRTWKLTLILLAIVIICTILTMFIY